LRLQAVCVKWEDVGGLEAVGELQTGATCDTPSPPQLTPVEVRAPPVLHSVEADAEQRHEQSDATRPRHFTRFIEFRLRAMWHHLPYGITQCYLPPNTSEHTPP